MEQTVGTLTVRVDKLERDSAELFTRMNATSVAQAAVSEKLSSMLVTLGEGKQAVSNLQGMPVRRWEWLVRAVLTAAVSGMCGYFLARWG